MQLSSLTLAITRIGARASTWVPNRLTGTTFSTTQILPGLSGSYNLNGDATRVFLSAPASLSATGGTLCCAIIKGTGATLSVPNTFSNYTGSLQVSVDGGNYTSVNGPTHTLFTGLSDTPHFVAVKIGAAYGDSSAHLVKASPNTLVITGGTDTYIDLPSTFAISNTTNALWDAAAFGGANTANFIPALTKYGTTGANRGAISIRGNFQKLFVSLNGVGVVNAFVSVNGASPTKYTSTPADNDGGHVFTIPATAGVNTYYVWTTEKGCVFSVAGDGVASNVALQRQMHQFGDSITEGFSGTSGDVEVFRVAAAMGYTGMTLGVAGWTLANIDSGLTTQLPQVVVNSDDIAIVAGGRNNVGGAFDAAEIASYQSIISKLVAKGYGKILCRGILPSGNRDNLWPAENGSIQSIVTGLANPNVIYVDVSGCPTYTTTSGDTVHPDAAGYATIAPYIEGRYRAALGL